ncbi:sensor histidine kinase [Hymenobacter puniceus]|uniref:sensor histidine kinase n=1 Tax=Hymenobacter sp. BT190 TaxID=2763505 RepID=UPI0016519988|nr:histidine kinase [Hymenobacter sp. BT190]MBC6697089.1 histidine kinase [Hymenobacter sp. BT190]
MDLSAFRPTQALVLHLVLWLLLGVLVFTQPAGQYPAAVHYSLKTGLLAVTLGILYLNMEWAVPRLLYRGRVGLYLGLVGLLAAVVVGTHGGLRQVLENQYATVPGLSFDGRKPDGPPRPSAAATRMAGRPGPPRHSWLDPAVLLSTLLVLGLGTSVAAVQRGQREAQLRQALEQEKMATELSWLKAQINPHFFFNTLNNIYALTLLDGDQAREALHRLSRMMRYVLYETQASATPLRQELQFVGDYLDLMQLRLTDNVTVHYHTPEVLQDVSVAPMLLLTFVENAFKHGVSALAPSRVAISVRQPTPHTLEVEVRNTVFDDRPVSLDHNSGIGLTNTRRRLELLYPGRHTLRITERTPENQYLVHLTLTLLP